MNYEKELAEALSKMNDAGDFVIEQAPLVVQEALTFYTFLHLFAAISMIALMWAIYKAFYYCKNRFEWRAGDVHLHAMIFLLVGFFVLIILIIQLVMLAMITLAPRVYLIEWLQGGM